MKKFKLVFKMGNVAVNLFLELSEIVSFINHFGIDGIITIDSATEELKTEKVK